MGEAPSTIDGLVRAKKTLQDYLDFTPPSAYVQSIANLMALAAPTQIDAKAYHRIVMTVLWCRDVHTRGGL
jgi:hypothetical protein